MNLKELSSALWEKLPYKESKNNTEIMLNVLFEVISSTLKKGEEVKVKGFGSFKVVTVKGGMKKLPGQTVAKMYPDKQKVKFIPSSNLKF